MLRKLCADALAENPKGVEQYKAGKTKAFGSFVGSVMAKTKGKADTGLVNEILKGMLEG